MNQVDLVRRYTIKKVNEIRIFISGLPERESTALDRLYGVEGVKTASAIADFVLVQLGHVPPAMVEEGTSPTVREARKVMPDRAAMEFDAQRAQRRK
jgi:hypothetical protein